MRRKGFTLAEVLITLAIIGIVASLTIPSLIKSYQEKETISQLLKSYAMLKQATLMITAECDGNILNCISDIEAEDPDTVALDEIAALYKPKLKVVKDCGTGTGCWYSGTIRYLNESDAWMQDDQEHTYKMILNDGKSFSIDWNGEGSLSTLYGLRIDLNGKKQPNQLGRDIFVFVYNANTGDLEPNGKTSPSSCHIASTGSCCSARILIERAINY